MTIGGLTVGVTPIDMAHAYETIAHGGQRVSGTLVEPGAPVGIQEVEAGGRALPDGARRDVNRVLTKRVLAPEVAATETSMLETVLQYGTGKAAALGQFAAGKTGTTSNYGDAWFVGWDAKYTVAVWVGYPNKLIPMSNDFDGGPVLGGTFPALIWHAFMSSALQIDRARAEAAATHGSAGTSGGEATTGETGSAPSSPASTPGQSGPQGSAPGAGRKGTQPGRRQGTRRGSHAGRPRTQRRTVHAGARARNPGTGHPDTRRAASAELFARADRRRRAPPASSRAPGARRSGCPRRRSASGSSTAWLMPMRLSAMIAGSLPLRGALADQHGPAREARRRCAPA